MRNNYNNKVFYMLTHPQKRIWYIEKIYPSTSLYNIGGSIRVKGTIDFNILEESINLFINKNDGLRLRFVEECGEIKQYVSDYEKIKIDLIDFSRYEEPEGEFNKWLEIEARKPFVLEKERLFYFAMFKISDNDNGYLAKFHHIISDGWSTNIMTNQICDNYMKLLNGEEINDKKEYSYIGYIESEKEYLSSSRFHKNKSFWNEMFKVLPDMLLNKSSDNIEGKRKTYELDRELSYRIKKFVENNKCSLNTFFVTLYLVYLFKTYQHKDIVIGTPVLNRSGKREKSMFGMFTSTMPFRFCVDENLNMFDTMLRVNEELMECYFNQKYPYDLLIQDLELKKRGYDNLFNICVNYYNTKHISKLNGFEIENREFFNGNQLYSLQLVIKDWSDSGDLTLDFDYKVNDYSTEQIDGIYFRLINLINYIIDNPYVKLGDLSLLSNNEIKNLLYRFNDTDAQYPKDKVIYRLFEEQVERTPDKVAIRFYNKNLTYRELNKKANQLARYLVNKGVEDETIVGLLTTHSLEMVIGILGILKAGGAYLPIDPGYPRDRVCYMLEDSGVGIVVTNLKVADDLKFNMEIIDLNDQNIFVGEASNSNGFKRPNDLVYIIYTSGSTGKPKGTMIEHQGLVNYSWWAKKMYVKDENEVFVLYSSLAFDLTITSIFIPLISGNTIIVYDDSDDEEYVLYRIMKENKATVIKLTPSHLSLLKDVDNTSSSVRRFIVGGEDLKVSIAKEIHESFGGNIEIFNEYGPTETVVGCMIHKYDYVDDTRISVPIGIPADNVQIYILDKNLKPVSENTIGEMYISGDGVARGYLNRPELTCEKFAVNPFINGKRMYKTGDLARFLSNGKIEYIGRADQQVKIRGYRIEMGEIEKYLLTHGSIKEAVVIDLEDENNNKFLCAYVVKKAKVLTGELKDFLLRYLPDYMIPLYFIELVEIPLTINGKINRVLLPKPKTEITGNVEFIPYRNENEKKLAEAICEVLNIEKIDMRQNFYHLGGDSIKAIQISSKLNDKGFKIKVKDILSNPIIEEMALFVEQTNRLVIGQRPCEGSIISGPIVDWFLEQKFSDPNHYNQSILLELQQDIEIKKLETIMNELIRHHDSLRINYKEGELFYNNEHSVKHYYIEEYDLTDLSISMQVDRMRLIAEDFKSGFNMESDILIKSCVFNLGQNNKKWLLTAHHLVVDGVSWRIILEDISTMLKQLNSGQKITLLEKTSSYKEWTNALKECGEREFGEEKEYWNSVLNKDFNFPIDYDLGKGTIESSNTYTMQVCEELTDCLLTRSNASYNTEPKDLLITSLLRTIKQLTGNEDIVIELEGHGREEIFADLDISRTVGWFTSLYPFYTGLKGDDLSHQIKAVKEEIRKIPNNGIGFGILKHMIKSLKGKSKKYVRFNYLGEFNTEHDNSFVKLLGDQLGGESSKQNHLTCIIDINCFVVNKMLNVLVTYSRNKFSDNSMKKFINNFINNLEEIVDYCSNKESVEFTPSDFNTVEISQEELESLFN